MRAGGLLRLRGGEKLDIVEYCALYAQVGAPHLWWERRLGMSDTSIWHEIPQS